MGFFSDLKDDLSQAVNELNDQINPGRRETVGVSPGAAAPPNEEQTLTEKKSSATEQEISLNEMLEKIDTYDFLEEFMQEVSDPDQEELPEEEALLVNGKRLAVKMPDAEIEDWADEADGFDLEPLWKKIEEESVQPTLSEEELEELLKTHQEAPWEMETEEEVQEDQPEEQPEEIQELFQEEQPWETQELFQEEQPEETQELFQEEQPEETRELFQEEQPEETRELFQEEQPEEQQENIFQEERLEEFQGMIQEDTQEEWQMIQDEPQDVQEMLQEETIEIQNEDYKGAEKEMETSNIRAAVDEISTITEAMIVTGDIVTEGSINLLGTVNGNIDALGKLSVTGRINGNSKAAEVYAENARINGEIVSEGAVKIGASSVIIGDITATSVVITGAVEGNIDVQGPVVLDSSAIVMGNIKSKSVQINNGAVIEGMCSQCYSDVRPASFFEDYKPENHKAESV